MPSVSVIVPVYNAEKYLHRCVNSILTQTHTDLELILVDDGSPDECPLLCDEYAKQDLRVRVIHKDNEGVSAARNTGLQSAKGEYVVFVDSDDRIDKDWIYCLYEAAQPSHADMVIGGYIEEDEFGAVLETHQKISETIVNDTLSERLLCLLTDVLGYTGRRLGWSSCTRMFRRDIIQEHQIRFCTTCGNYAEDMGFLIEYGLYCRTMCTISKCGYLYLQHNDSMMDVSEKTIKLPQVNEISYQFGKRFFKEISDRKWRKRFPVFHYLILHHEYEKLVYSDQYAKLADVVKNIEHIDWHKHQTSAIKQCRSFMTQLWGERAARQVVLLSRYGRHTNWKRYKIECAIAYKFFIPKASK